jgi:hypothetical protein
MNSLPSKGVHYWEMANRCRLARIGRKAVENSDDAIYLLFATGLEFNPSSQERHWMKSD